MRQSYIIIILSLALGCIVQSAEFMFFQMIASCNKYMINVPLVQVSGGSCGSVGVMAVYVNLHI